MSYSLGPIFVNPFALTKEVLVKRNRGSIKLHVYSLNLNLNLSKKNMYVGRLNTIYKLCKYL